MVSDGSKRMTPKTYEALAHLKNVGVSFMDEWDRSYLALQRRGLVSFRRAQKYGKSCWILTDKGKQWGEELVP